MAENEEPRTHLPIGDSEINHNVSIEDHNVTFREVAGRLEEWPSHRVSV
jgi:hypothetical protein